MGLVDALQSDILGSADLSDVLRKAKVVAFRLRNDEFKAWVDHELDGYYGDNVAVPEYRVMTVHSFGTFTNRAWLREQDPMPMEVFPQEIRDMLKHLELRQGVREPESMVASMATSKYGYLMEPWPRSAMAIVSSRLTGGFQCVDAWRAITRELVVGVLDTIKNRLLTLTLELADRYPEAAEERRRDRVAGD